MNKLKFIKTIVFIITFLLVFGSLLLLTIIYRKARPEPEKYEELSLEQPLGSSIESINIIDNNLAILIKNGGEPDRIILYNPVSRKKSLSIHL